MGLTPFIPLAGVAVGSLAIAAAKRLQDGPLFADVFRNVSRPENTPPTVATSQAVAGAERQAETAQLLARWQRESLPLLARHGIDPDQPLQLQVDDEGQVTFGSHPEQAALEEWLAQHPQLQTLVRQLAESVRQRRNEAAPGWAPRRISLTLRDGTWRIGA